MQMSIDIIDKNQTESSENFLWLKLPVMRQCFSETKAYTVLAPVS